MSTEQEVIVLIAERTGRPESSITPEKTFYRLGIDGDDAVEPGHACRNIPRVQRRIQPEVAERARRTI